MSGLTACGNTTSSTTTTGKTSTSTSENVSTIVVTFNMNYEGGTNQTVNINSGSAVSKPTDPTRTGYTFDAWYTDYDCTLPFDFTTIITENLTLYANWLEEGVTYYTVTLHYNDGTTANTVLRVKENGRAAQPSAPERENHVFYSWYSDETLTTKFIFSTKITANIDLYAKWGKLNTFEAEDLIFTDLSGPGYSGSTSGKSMIISDSDGSAKASNGFYVTYLYAKYDSTQYNTTLSFHFDSSAAVSDAKLYLRLSAEYQDITINGDNYQVLVNNSILSYNDIIFTGAASYTTDRKVLPFADFLVSASIGVAQGENVITLRTNNTTKQGTGGTMNSTAPMVDCIKVAADDSVTMDWTSGYKGTNNYTIE